METTSNEQPAIVRFKDPWGFSKLDVYRACTAKFKYQFLLKLPQASSPAMERGGKIHENIESYLNGWVQDLDEAAEPWKAALDALKGLDFKGEQALGLDKDWLVLPDWFDKRTWLRVKIDTIYKIGKHGTVIDYKTGRYREPSTDQVEIYALAGFSLWPDVEDVTAEFWFIDSGETYKRVYNRTDLPPLRAKYEREAAKLYNETKWNTQPSTECRYCPYSRTKNGPCRF